jgi:hypothetical protein
MTEISWHRSEAIITVRADQQFGTLLRQMEIERAEWIVVVNISRQEDTHFYAFRAREIRDRVFLTRPASTLERALDLGAIGYSEITLGRQSLGYRPNRTGGLAASRLVDVDDSGRVVAIGERLDWIGFNDQLPDAGEEIGASDELYGVSEIVDDSAVASSDSEQLDLHVGPDEGELSAASAVEPDVFAVPGVREPAYVGAGSVRGADLEGASPGAEGRNDDWNRDKFSAEYPAETSNNAHSQSSAYESPDLKYEHAIDRQDHSKDEIELTLSAESKAQIPLGGNEIVDFRLELAAEAVPLSVSQFAFAKPKLPIVVSLSVENQAVEIVRDREYTLDPPTTGKPQHGHFVVKGLRAGTSRVAVSFRQGGSTLGVIGLALEVVTYAPGNLLASGEATAETRMLEDDDKLSLLVEQRCENGRVFYEYILYSEALGLPFRRIRSLPLLDRGSGLAATTQAFVERIYEKVTRELKSQDDLKELQREARALGASLSQELFEPDVAGLIWSLRSRITVIQIVSWEPYIPWELVRLRDPATGDIDDRFLAEYGLVRTLSDDMPPRALAMEKWGYLDAKFPMETFPPVGEELDYFTTMAPQTALGRGIKPEAVSATPAAFYEALATGQFDVFHISCHAESSHKEIDGANLIIGDELVPGESRARLVQVDSTTVAAEAKLRERRPIVFLNACETGRAGPVLTALGGWPNVFLRAGAGAFVGTSWAVRDKPASAFAIAFYNALLDGKPLADAASAARQSAKILGDASWLAFKVYGHPHARRALPNHSPTAVVAELYESDL